MLVEFRKGKRDLCEWTAYPAKRRPITSIGGGGFQFLPHDLAQLVVERELGHRYGFWGCLADGATFRSVVRTNRRLRRTPRGTAVIAAHVAPLDAAEHDVDRHVLAWRRGDLSPVADALTAVHHAWLALPEGAEMSLEVRT